MTMPTSHHVLIALLLIQIPSYGLGKNKGGWPKCLASVIHVGDSDQTSGSWLWLTPALTIVAKWGVNQ